MKTYRFASSRNPKVIYTTTLHDNGVVTCNCPAWTTCWHVKRIADGPPPILFRVSAQDRWLIRALAEEGNEKGALEMTHDLFPSMSEEEARELVNEIVAGL